ncbi:type II CAAX endopeptidase family protein [Treponema sp.]|uniref:CPBP family intramembrane glutamic endopeptidase n=1 Tax=Treponema sp. TaxID=166 RepID=UPI0025D671F9|nr:type II CAAX endopeptidase family protein [Treponema sp.]MCR5218436.1 CPBP family intramembrane metalloprotease [Treponema sp.]
MKKKYIFIQLLAVLLLLVLPTFTAESSSSFNILFSFSFYSAIQLFMALILDGEFRIFLKDNNSLPFENTFSLIVNHLKWGGITLGLLMLTYALMTALAIFLPASFSQSSQSTALTVPGLKGILFLIMNVMAASYYEEVIYRQLLPQSFYLLSENKAFRLSGEIFTLIVFALGHFYLGFIAVINAFICGIFLRLCRIKTRSVSTGAAAHFIYNFTLFSFMILMSLN